MCLKQIIPVLGLLGILLWSCTPEIEAPLPQTRYNLRFMNFNSRAEPVDIRLREGTTSQIATDDLGFEDFWPIDGYASLLVTARDTFSEVDSTLLTYLDILDNRTKEVLFEPIELGIFKFPSSVAIIDSFGKSIVIQTADDFEIPEGGFSTFRFFNFNQNFSSVSLEIKNDTVLTRSNAFLNSSGFLTTTSGKKTLYFVNNLSRTIIDSIPNFN
ncbi:MAG: hypothetical protein AAFR59_17865, partial [Bacteroidota bacterium]